MNLYSRIINFVNNFDNLELRKDNASNGFYYKYGDDIWLKMNEIERIIYTKFSKEDK